MSFATGPENMALLKKFAAAWKPAVDLEERRIHETVCMVFETPKMEGRHKDILKTLDGTSLRPFVVLKPGYIRISVEVEQPGINQKIA